MRGRIVRTDRLVEPFADDRAVEHDHGADRHLAPLPRLLRKNKGGADELTLHYTRGTSGNTQPYRPPNGTIPWNPALIDAWRNNGSLLLLANISP